MFGPIYWLNLNIGLQTVGPPKSLSLGRVRKEREQIGAETQRQIGAETQQQTGAETQQEIPADTQQQKEART